MADGEKTEKATPKRRNDERKKGNVFKSQDAISVVTLLGSFFTMNLMAENLVAEVTNFFQYCMSLARDQAPGMLPTTLGHLCVTALMSIVRTVLPIIAVTILCAVVSTFFQTKMLVTTEPLKPKFSRLNPLQGFKKLFSLKSLIEALKGILKISVLMVIVYQSVVGLIQHLTGFLYTDLPTSVRYLFDAGMSMFYKILLAFTVIAVLDFFYQRWDYERSLKMSKQEIKEEYKQMEGDPQVKGKIKEIQRRRAMSRMMQQVPSADVVVRNPTHYAVALRYRPEQDAAPIVLAKGQDAIALRIVQIAEENQVAVIENVPLARALYAGAELNQEIPPELYGAVAEVLVYIFRLDSNHKIVK